MSGNLNVDTPASVSRKASQESSMDDHGIDASAAISLTANITSGMNEAQSASWSQDEKVDGTPAAVVDLTHDLESPVAQPKADHNNTTSTIITADTIPSSSARSVVTATVPEGKEVEEEEEEKKEKTKSRAPKTKKNARCRYFGTKKGCRAGNSCPFLHDVAVKTEDQPSLGDPEPNRTKTNVTVVENIPGNSITPTQKPVASQKKALQRPQVVQKPVSNAEKTSPRDFQLNQIRRRFSPTEKVDERQTTILTFKLVPSDPDFPFELDALLCSLSVPVNYPSKPDGRPTLRVTNPEMERGYQINVERGFDALVSKYPNKTLLALMNELDRDLESFLTPEKAQTIKLIPNARPSSSVAGPSARVPVTTVVTDIPKEVKPSPAPVVYRAPSPVYTADQRAAAASRRAADIRQLEARMGRQPLFFKYSDGVTFTVPIQPKSPHLLPLSLQNIKSVKLIVPMSYNLDPCRIELSNVERGPEAHLVEAAFQTRAKEHPEMNLTTQLNLLGVNMHSMAKEVNPSAKSTEVPEMVPIPEPVPEMVPLVTAGPSQAAVPKHDSIDDDGDDRDHIKFIPRPPEWSQTHEANDDDDEDTYSDTDFNDEFTDSQEEGGVEVPQLEAPAAGPERGVLLSFPFLELYGIELLELASIALVIKCDRCKTIKDIKGLRSQVGAEVANTKTESCNKCASVMSVGFRKELMHPNSVKAGFLDLEGCTVVDLLPSDFIPTCSECSTPYPAPGVSSVRGESRMVMCRECHRKMNFKIPEVKFLVVSNRDVRVNRPLPRRRPKENLGIVAGQELPRKGRCAHYGKSYRWFRFGCCSKVYPCDRCHDAAEDHPNEHASRMICGHCSREQPYRPENCAFCHALLIGKKGGGFWEGGKGTRDQVRMNRKDPRKYRRRGGQH